MRYGFIKVAAGSPKVSVADVDANAAEIRALISRADSANVNLLVLPELCVTGCTCGELFNSETLLSAAQEALVDLAHATENILPVVIIGLPLVVSGSLYNCAAVLHDGRILGLIPKTSVGSQRQFVPGTWSDAQSVVIDGQSVPFGAGLRFDCVELPEFSIGVETGDTLRMAEPASAQLCSAGATVIATLSASEELAGRSEFRRMQLRSVSARLVCGSVLANANRTESTQDMVFSAHDMIVENGSLLAENEPFGADDMIVSEIDVRYLVSERRRVGFTADAAPSATISFSQPLRETTLTRRVSPAPFIPETKDAIAVRAEEILRIQSYGLKKRMEHAYAKTLVVGISGGLDSCLALLVMVRTMDLAGRSRKDIIALSMPCFGTTNRTRSNAEKMCEELGVSFREVNISASVRQHFADLGHDESVRDVTYENAQARERTQLLMDTANQYNGLVVGTGDLSELALGWATYNGDHMSMYGVNAGIPKTLIRHIVRYEAGKSTPELAKVLLDILDTPVSPELLPADSSGQIQQKTEDLVGPYELHDFFIYYALRRGYSPSKIFRLARCAFAGTYSDETILKWLRTFFRRFFIQQFKRSCLPDGPKVGTVSLSPRGDWQMPSDACSTIWLKEVDSITI